MEPDGSTRRVEYTADPESGFKAIVKKDHTQGPSEIASEIIEKKSIRDYGKLESIFDYPSLKSLMKNENQEYMTKYNNFDSNYNENFYINTPKEYNFEENLYKENRLKNTYSTIKSPKVSSDSDNNDKYSKIIEIDLTKNFKHLNYKPNKNYRVIEKEAPIEYSPNTNYEEKYIDDSANIDLDKLISPFAINGHFKMPKLIETGFQPITSYSKNKNTNYESANDLDFYELTPTSELNKLFPTMETIKFKKTSNSNKKYTSPELFHYTATNIMDDFTVLPKSKYTTHTKMINPHFELKSYLPPSKYAMSNLDDEFSIPHYSIDYETMHIPHDDRLHNRLNRHNTRDGIYTGRRTVNKRDRRPWNHFSQFY